MRYQRPILQFGLAGNLGGQPSWRPYRQPNVAIKCVGLRFDLGFGAIKWRHGFQHDIDYTRQLAGRGNDSLSGRFGLF
jgi:hypothetical protein